MGRPQKSKHIIGIINLATYYVSILYIILATATLAGLFVILSCWIISMIKYKYTVLTIIITITQTRNKYLQKQTFCLNVKLSINVEAS